MPSDTKSEHALREFYEALICEPAQVRSYFTDDAEIVRNGRPQSIEGFVMHWSHLCSNLSNRELLRSHWIMKGPVAAVSHTLTGRNSGQLYDYDDNGLCATLCFTDVLELRGTLISSMRSVADDLSFHQSLAVIGPKIDAVAETAKGQRIADFRPGTFLESIALNDVGDIFVSSLYEGVIYKLSSDVPTSFAALPLAKSGRKNWIACLVFGEQGELYASTMSEDADVNGFWCFDELGNGKRLGALPPSVAGNGIGIDAKGNLYIADSFGGRIWRLRKGASNPDVWCEHELIARRPILGQYPGANGLQIEQNGIYVTNSDKALILRIPIRQDGAAGDPDVVCSAMPGDDFAISGRFAYCTTHPFNQIVRIDLADGIKTLIASEKAGVIGPTACTFGSIPPTKDRLYIVGDGGLREPGRKGDLKPRVVALDLN